MKKISIVIFCVALAHNVVADVVVDYNDIQSATVPARTMGSGPSPLTEEAFKNTDLFGPSAEPKDVYLNFEGAELKSFIEYIADIKGMNIIPDKSIAGNKISLNFRNPVSKTGAWNAFLTILEMANFSIVKVGNIYRIVTRDKKFKQPLPTFIGVEAKSLPDTDATIRYIALLNNLPASDVKSLLTSMLSQPSNVIDPPNINGFIITDCACTIKAAMHILEEMDLTGVQESVYVMTLKRANATDVKTLFDSLITKPDGNPLAKLLGRPEDASTFFTPGTRIIAESRTNKLILMGQRQALEKIKEFIINHVDTELKQAKSPLRIYELQNANAEDIVTILQEVTDSSNASSVGQQAAQYGAIRDGVRYFKSMKFKADKDGNRLLVSCRDDHDWELLQKTIQQLDKAQPQVALQMLIVTVTADSDSEFGGQMRNKNHDLLGGSIDFQTTPLTRTVFEVDNNGNQKSLLGNLLSSLSLNQGSSVLSIGKVASPDGIFGVLRALKTDGNATILSQPFAIAANCTETKVEVGTQTYITTQETGGANGITGQSPVKAATTITFTPQVNSEGIIRLKMDANISDFVDSTGLSTQTKHLNTTVTVANGQVLVIGGFVKTKVTDTGSQTPIWGSVPILGWLAKNMARSIAKEYLFLFLCPTIVKPRTAPGIGMYSKINLHRAAKDIEKTVQTTKTNDPIHNWFFNANGENYSHKVIDFANARYQPNNVDVRFDPYYRDQPDKIDTVQEVLTIDNTPASPDDYWRNRTKKNQQTQKKQINSNEMQKNSTKEHAEITDIEPEIVSQPEQKETKLKKQKTTITQEQGPEKIQIPAHKARENENVQEESSPENKTTAVFNIENTLATNRSKLRSLLSQKGLSDLLTQAPSEPTITEYANEEALEKDEPLTKNEISPAENNEDEEAEETAPPAMIGRRQGIQDLFSAEDEQSSAPNNLIKPPSSGLHALLGGK